MDTPADQGDDVDELDVVPLLVGSPPWVIVSLLVFTLLRDVIRARRTRSRGRHSR